MSGICSYYSSPSVSELAFCSPIHSQGASDFFFPPASACFFEIGIHYLLGNNFFFLPYGVMQSCFSGSGGEGGWGTGGIL